MDVNSIKKMLSEGDHLLFDYSSVEHNESKFPSEKKSKKYNLDIYELHQSTDGNNGAAGTSLLIVKQDYDRLFNSNLSIPCTRIEASESNQSTKEAYKVNRTIAIAIDTTSQNIPEVRAGPHTIGNS
jgi:hypothetical protein